MYYVYVLKCKEGNIYTGCTHDLKDRIERHKKGYVIATKERRPIELITYTAFQDKYKAFEFEIYLKSGSGRAFIKKHFL
ncbi:MAG: GIY-YIG nuclease family protein [Candidatus Pacebacteria bacterium]|nr:GIY-YIG nuclease family protein [Candidatus Paceibacterota bacterium]